MPRRAFLEDLCRHAWVDQIPWLPDIWIPTFQLYCRWPTNTALISRLPCWPTPIVVARMWHEAREVLERGPSWKKFLENAYKGSETSRRSHDQWLTLIKPYYLIRYPFAHMRLLVCVCVPLFSFFNKSKLTECSKKHRNTKSFNKSQRFECSQNQPIFQLD